MAQNTVASVHVKFCYSQRDKAGFSIYKDETLIFSPKEDADEFDAAFRYIKRLMAKTPEYCVYVIRLDDTNPGGYGYKSYAETNCLMLRHEQYNTDVVEILEWGGEHYDRNKRYASTNAATQELLDAIKIHQNWIFI